MRLGAYLSQMTSPELEEIQKKLNLSDDEEMIFSLLSKGKSINQCSLATNLSISTVERRISDIKRKVNRL